MADPTTNYSWDLPDVGGDSGAWGAALNSILGDDSTGIDAVIKAVSDVADAALPKAGGTMTGNLHLLTESYTPVNQGSVSGAVALDASAGNFFRMATTGNITALSFSNEPASGKFYAALVQITAGGLHAVTWSETVNWHAGTTPSQTASGVDLYFVYTYDGGSTWYGIQSATDLS